MALAIIRGPAGGGKSQHIEREHRPGEVVIDFTRLYGALALVERGPDGRYPVRETGDPLLPLISAIKAYAIREAARRQLSGHVTTSSSAPAELARLRELGAKGPAITIDPGEATIRARLSDAETGQLHPQCETALRRWYGPAGP